METLKAINALLREFQQQVERIVAPTKQEHDEQVNLAYASTMGKLCKLCRLFPDIMPIGGGTKMSADEVQNIISNLKRSVATKFSAPLLPSYNMLQKEVCGKKFNIPSFEAWQGASSKEANFVIHYNKATESDAISAMNYLVGNMLLSLPIKRVHLNFVDLNYSGAAALFTTKLDKSLFRDVIYTTQEFQEFCEEMQQRLGEAVQDLGGNLIKYNEENQTYRYPYDVVVLIGYPNQFDHAPQQLSPLFENGHKGGIYFVVMNNRDIQMPNHNNESLIDKNEHYTSLDLTASAAGQAKPVSCLEDKSLAKSLFKYINEEAAKKPKAKAVKANYQEMFNTPYLNVEKSTLLIPVGVDDNGEQVEIITDIYNHVSSLIIGGTGSGKSKFVKNIIANAMMMYSPEDLQLYLLDFKGVELFMFKESKHVRALLTNGKDLDIDLELFKDINREYERRNLELFPPVGCTDITAYNKKFPNKRLPQIIIVADECQLLFCEKVGGNSLKHRQLIKIICDLARLGRNVGIHLIFATQTLKGGTDFPSEILSVIHDHYLLRCDPDDSERLIPGSSKFTDPKVTQAGTVFCREGINNKTFRSYYIDDSEQDGVMRYILRKSKDVVASKPVLINGLQQFELTNEIIDKLPASDNNVAAIGCSFDLKHRPITIELEEGTDGENILFFGINDKEQVTHTVMNALVSLVYTARNNGRLLRTCVIDCLGKEDGDYLDVLNKLSGEGLISVISNKREIGEELLRIATSIHEQTASPTLLVVLGQNLRRFYKQAINHDSQPKLNQGIDFDDRPADPPEVSSQQPHTPESVTAIGGSVIPNEQEKANETFLFDVGTTNSITPPINVNHNNESAYSSSPKEGLKFSTCRDALDYILVNGPYCNVNTLLQVDKPKSLQAAGVYSNSLSHDEITERFCHIVALRSNENVSSFDFLEQLPSDPNKLRAIYYSDNSGDSKIFIPYVIKQLHY